MFETHKPLYILGAVASIGLLGALFWAYTQRAGLGAPAVGANVPRGEGYIASPPSPEIAQMIERSSGFDVLVSYTDQGFEPAGVRVERGQTVRFTNNSSGDLWITSDAGTIGKANAIRPSACGEETFGTCGILKPGEFWEFTFEKIGAWQYRAARSAGEAVIRVE